MLNFTDVSALHSLLKKIYEVNQGKGGSQLLSTILQRDLQFTAEQSDRYSSSLLTRDADDSADCIYRNAYMLIGTWARGNSGGTAGNLVVSRTETWTFSEDLTYENKNESYEGYVSPFGGGYSRPRSSSSGGIWASSDHRIPPFSLITIDADGKFTSRTVAWTEGTGGKPKALLMNGYTFGRM
jgi:hypothetical protein